MNRQSSQISISSPGEFSRAEEVTPTGVEWHSVRVVNINTAWDDDSVSTIFTNQNQSGKLVSSRETTSLLGSPFNDESRDDVDYSDTLEQKVFFPSRSSDDGSSGDNGDILPVDDEGPSDAKRTGHILTWSHIDMRAKSSHKKEPSHVLKNISGALLPGELTAIMGHSGAGKTSLLNILAGKVKSTKNVQLTYDIQLDGESIMPSSINVRRKIAFVAQRDVLLHTATPREAVRFSARLRLDRGVSDNDIENVTSEILEELGLSRVADSQIATLSGGEMRRTSLGIELVVRPSIVLLDEVTSGLDSYNAMQVLDVLKKVSLCGASVLFTLHQPNSQMFAAIDHLILLQKGRCMYQGPVKEIPEYYANRGFEVPPNYNPADWVLMVSEGKSTTEELENVGFFRDFPQEERRKKMIGEMEQSLAALANIKQDEKTGKKMSVFETLEIKKRVSVWREIRMLLRRGINNTLRDRKLLILRFSIIGVGAAIIAIAFFQVANGQIESIIDFQSHLGAVFFLCMAGIIVTQVVLLEFIDERPVVLREFSTDHYRMISYSLNRMIMEGLTVFLQVVLFFVVTYWAMGLQGRPWYLLLCFYTFAMAGASLAVLLGSYKNDPRDAKELIPMLMLPQLIFSGFFVALEDLPHWLRWVNRAMPLTYTFRLVIAEEFSFCYDEDAGAWAYVCPIYLEEQGATDDMKYQYWGILVGMIVLFRLLATFFLRKQIHSNDSVTRS